MKPVAFLHSASGRQHPRFSSTPQGQGLPSPPSTWHSQQGRGGEPRTSHPMLGPSKVSSSQSPEAICLKMGPFNERDNFLILPYCNHFFFSPHADRNPCRLPRLSMRKGSAFSYEPLMLAATCKDASTPEPRGQERGGRRLRQPHRQQRHGAVLGSSRCSR